MLCVKTILKESNISGIGLFADEDILKNTIVWKFEPLIDILLTKEDIDKLSENSKQQVYNYAFVDTYHNKYMLCGDDGRFFNHSDNYNCNDSEKNITIAIKDILKGEELTVDYKAFYGDYENIKDLLK